MAAPSSGPHTPPQEDNDEDKTPTHLRLDLVAALRQAQAVELPDSGPRPQARRPCLVVLAGPRIGEVVAVDDVLMIGREPRSGLHLLDEGVSRRHCTVALEGTGVRLTDLDSTNGTWVGGKRIRSHLLVDGERFRVGQTTVIKFALQDAVEEQYQRQLFETALRDPLTHAFNRRYFMERLEAEVAYAERHQVPLALLLCNVDRFEQVNRIVGREAGDGLLRSLAETLQGAIRTDDVLARLDHDTFAVIGRETGLDGGARLAERLRGVVADSLYVVRDAPVELRLSIGLAAAVPGGDQRVDALLGGAQAALRKAKDNGRNRVCIHEMAAGASTEAWAATESFE